MATWKFSDGVELSSGGSLRGGPARSRDALHDRMRGARVRATPMPSSPVPLDASNDFLLNLFAHQVAHELGLGLDTEYEPSIEDAPPEIAAAIRALTGPDSAPFGAVH